MGLRNPPNTLWQGFEIFSPPMKKLNKRKISQLIIKKYPLALSRT